MQKSPEMKENELINFLIMKDYLQASNKKTGETVGSLTVFSVGIHTPFLGVVMLESVQR